MRIYLLLIMFLSVTLVYASQTQDSMRYESEHLSLRTLSSGAVQHISYMEVAGFGRVECNGLVYIDQGQAFIVDSPASLQASKELLDYLQGENLEIKGWVATHFHLDCVAGQEVFQKAQIPFYAHSLTLEHFPELQEKAYVLRDTSQFILGTDTLQFWYLGAGHTRDNILVYKPKDRVLFGGCLIKELGADKGNLEDADVQAWPLTIQAVQHTFSEASIVVPGHGQIGGRELFRYTRQLFQ